MVIQERSYVLPVTFLCDDGTVKGQVSSVRTRVGTLSERRSLPPPVYSGEL